MVRLVLQSTQKNNRNMYADTEKHTIGTTIITATIRTTVIIILITTIHTIEALMHNQSILVPAFVRLGKQIRGVADKRWHR